MSNDITLSAGHTAARASGALAATLVLLNSGTTGSKLDIYATARPAQGVDPGVPPIATFTLPKPAGTISAGVLTLGAVADALIYSTGIAVWARFSVDSSPVIDCDVSNTSGTATVQLAATQLYAGGSVRLASGVLG